MVNKAILRGLAAVALVGIPVFGALADPSGITYTVHVRTNYGTVFKDCFAFGTDGTLTIGGLASVAYTTTAFGPGNHSLFEAITPAAVTASLGDSFSFTGYGFTYGRKGGTGYIKGIGFSGSNNKFVINGLADPECKVPAGTLQSNPFFPPQ